MKKLYHLQVVDGTTTELTQLKTCQKLFLFIYGTENTKVTTQLSTLNLNSFYEFT